MMKKVRYKRAYVQRMLEFFSAAHHEDRTDTAWHPNGEVRQEKVVREANELPTFEAFAASLGTSRAQLRLWREQDDAFAAAWARCEDLQRDMLIQNALQGLYNASFARFLAAAIGIGDAPAEDPPTLVDDVPED